MQKLFSVALFATSGLAVSLDMVHGQISLAGVSQFTSANPFSSVLKNYGCYCFHDSVHGGVSGKPQSGIDSLCKKLAQCHKCISDDYGVPATMEWEFGHFMEYEWSILNGDIGCAVNSDQHKKDLCECDAAFATATGALFADGNWPFTTHGMFVNIAATCVGSQGGEAECCGTYPNRKPFQTMSHECCADNSVATLGSC